MRATLVAILAAGLAFEAGACSPAGGGPAPCTAVAPTECPTPAPRYAEVAPVIAQRCAAPCHAGVLPDGPWSLADYDHVADWADVIRAELLTCDMPPADGGVTITEAERLAILTWIRCGYPQ